MSTEPYASAQRVFWVVDNGTIHRGQRTVDRLAARWPNLTLVDLPPGPCQLAHSARLASGWAACFAGGTASTGQEAM